MEKLNPLERFLRYVQVDTQSDEGTGTSPSTAKQHDLAKLLAAELKEMGAKEITYDKKHCYVYATIPATAGYEKAPTLGFIAHMDTSPAVSGAGVKPKLIKKYDGKDIVLNKKKQIVMRVEEFPELAELEGESLVVTDGTTLLGADDKAGVAEIMTMAAFLLKYPEIGHGKLRIGFTPDEEIGCGPDHFNLELFGADFAYTVDGGALGELEYENFNAAGAKLIVNGRNTHPGSAKGKMKNAILIAQEFQSLLPTFENPMYTEGYEGFYHLDQISGCVDKTVCDYIIRDHDKELFEKKKAFFLECAAFLNRKYGEGTVEVELKDSYYNMREVLASSMHLVENAEAAMEELGIVPKVMPIRGGTDGARLSFLGLPCPNLCTGGANYHSRFEYVHVQGMEKTTELLVRLVETYANQKRTCCK
ncbi:MAG: peptidase T [Lachnospiraceae bacterium]|nr:peptidase T [Lachnospiraceae bacterium]